MILSNKLNMLKIEDAINLNKYGQGVEWWLVYYNDTIAKCIIKKSMTTCHLIVI